MEQSSNRDAENEISDMSISDITDMETESGMLFSILSSFIQSSNISRWNQFLLPHLFIH